MAGGDVLSGAACSRQCSGDGGVQGEMVVSVGVVVLSGARGHCYSWFGRSTWPGKLGAGAGVVGGDCDATGGMAVAVLKAWA